MSWFPHGWHIKRIPGENSGGFFEIRVPNPPPDPLPELRARVAAIYAGIKEGK